MGLIVVGFKRPTIPGWLMFGGGIVVAMLCWAAFAVGSFTGQRIAAKTDTPQALIWVPLLFWPVPLLGVFASGLVQALQRDAYDGIPWRVALWLSVLSFAQVFWLFPWPQVQTP